jgi:cytochrome c oxidase cbb3-type subunit 3
MSAGSNETGRRTSPVEVAEYEIADAPIRDAIGEEDNEIPLWFNVGFYGMIVFGIFYLLYYTLSGWSAAGQYEAEVSSFLEKYPPAAASVASTNPLRGQPDAIAAGQKTFTTVCAACHKPDGKGLIGPSLVDPYWKYGSEDTALFESVSKGRPGGMPPWGTQLSDDEIWSALAYMETLPRESTPGVGAPKEAADAAGSGGAEPAGS